jgi:hypothetical protein
VTFRPRPPPAATRPTNRTPLRRHAHTLRRILFNVPARIIRTGRRLILRLPAAHPHADIFQSTLDAIYTLAPP